jgi:ribosome modulation factor
MAAPQDSKSWKAGYAAGLAGKRNKCPADVEDEQAWYSGYIEGQADRERLQPRPTR